MPAGKAHPRVAFVFNFSFYLHGCWLLICYVFSVHLEHTCDDLDLVLYSVWLDLNQDSIDLVLYSFLSRSKSWS
ncbi:hypothetical protein SORBI_3003G164600 [Sorghum bicolor]|uniref:Uncharacterized protein n=1 Tax=Sorghum bicolor TaxID=4558 RepID=A0A1B6Q3L0_SORBI|nr:hypothetical protein SORBI_3003G164600 [Sorghum bicolor]